MRPRRDASIRIEEGRRLLRAGDYQGAVAALTEAISLYPASATAYSLRAQAYQYLGNRAKAAQDSQTLSNVRRSPLPPIGAEAHARNDEGGRLLEANDRAGAVRAFSEAIAAAPHFVAAYRNRAEAFRRLGEEAEATADLEEAGSIEASAPAPARAGPPSPDRPPRREPGKAAETGEAPGAAGPPSIFGIRLPWRRTGRSK